MLSRVYTDGVVWNSYTLGCLQRRAPCSAAAEFQGEHRYENRINDNNIVHMYGR